MTNETGSKAKANAVAKMRSDLEKAAEGLTHTSESDYPYLFFTLPIWDQSELNIDGFLRALGVSQAFVDEVSLPVDKLIQESKLENFLPSIDDLADRSGTDTKDPEVLDLSKRFRKLEAVLRKHLGDVKVFRVGQVEISCFIVGRDKSGNFAGLVTTSIET